MKRILSIAAALLGAGLITYSVYLTVIGKFVGDNLLSNFIFLLIGAAFLSLGVWGNLRRSKKLRALPPEARAALKKKNKKAVVVCAIILAIPALLLAQGLIINANREAKETSLSDKIFANYRDEYTATNAEPPENVKFVFVKKAWEDGRLSRNSAVDTSNNSLYGKYYTDKPSKLNVAVFYTITREHIGKWVDSGGYTISQAYEQTIELTVVRLSDWALIAETKITAPRNSNNLSKDGTTYTIHTGSERVVDYLTSLFE